MASRLQELFSESSKENFARLLKPQEFAKPVKDISDDVPQKKKKKPKHSKRTEKSEEGAAEAGAENDKSSQDEKEQRTCFVGNVSISQNRKSLSNLFKEFGNIESLRLRSVPIEGTAVDEDGNQSLVKKVCSNKQKFGDQKGSFNAYIVFKHAGSVSRAIESKNNSVLDNRHIRVDYCKPSVLEPKHTVFVGSLPYRADEEELRQYFANILPNGHEDINCVRIIRDPETLVGKGIAYVSFNSNDAVLKALSLDQSKFKKRSIRVSTCGKRTKRKQAETSQQTDSNKKRKTGIKFQTPAARRVEQKKAQVKQKPRHVKAVRGQKGDKKKSKKLGGVIKAAIKKAKKSS